MYKNNKNSLLGHSIKVRADTHVIDTDQVLDIINVFWKKSKNRKS